MSGVPLPPGAGLTKVADPRKRMLHWAIFLLIVAALVAGLWPYGLGSNLDQMRRQFVAIGYLQEARSEASSKPARRDAALRALNRAVALAPDLPQITDNAAQLYIGLRAYKESIPFLRQQASTSLLAKVSLGQALLMGGQKVEGEGVLAQVVAEAYAGQRTGRVPQALFAELMNDVGYIYVVAGIGVPQARRLIEVATKTDPQEPAFIDSLGWADFRLGDYLNAAFYLERAVRLALPEENAEMYYHLGAAYARLGLKRQARLTLKRCLDLDRSMEEARRELEQLSQDLPRPALAWGESTAKTGDRERGTGPLM